MTNKTSTSYSTPTSFLGAVANAYLSRYNDLSDFCFLFPNRRSGTFFIKRLAELTRDTPRLTPQIASISDFVATLSGYDVDSRIDLIFRLYKVYCALKGVPVDLADENGALDFDRFAPWGEVILNDFSEVDQYNVDADKLFYNVRILRDIESNYLTDEQIAVIERYFGYSPSHSDVTGFWKHFGIPEDETEPESVRTELRNKFAELWQLLPELYDGLRANLEADGLCLPGSAFRLALERVQTHGEKVLPWRKLVFVGFNSLSTSEHMLFAKLQQYLSVDDEPYADFLWDATGPVLDDTHSHAARELQRNRSNFPAPEWTIPFIAASDTDRMPQSLEVLAAPSNAAQTKLAGARVAEILKAIGSDKIRDARVAVVLPDENLLMPLLYSLPAELEEVNLTMGYSMRFSAIASFIYHLRRLQTRKRNVHGVPAFYHEDITLFLSHPLVHILIGSETANRINGVIAEKRLFHITIDRIREYSPVAAELLAPISDNADVEQTSAYLDSTLQMLDRALSENSDDPATRSRNRIERAHVILYRNALSRLLDSVREHNIPISADNVFRVVDRLLAGEKITFEGEPLEGLQVMGLLETRALDFDHLIVLSMNDKVMPRRGAKRTFIPDSLRRGYGLPVSSYAENLYSYYFYRMLSRASDVALIYDARAGEGMRSGGRSRFLMQLEMLYAHDRIRNRRFSFRYNGRKPEPLPIVKTPAVLENLALFLDPESKLNLSASSLMTYCQCPVKFYYEKVLKITTDDIPDKYIDAITQGNIVHNAMMHLYLPEEKQRKYLHTRHVLDTDFFDRMLSDDSALETLMRRMVNQEFYHLKGTDLDRPLPHGVSLVCEQLTEQVRSILRYDRSQAPIRLVGCEIPGFFSWKETPDSPAVNMKFSLDRVDEIEGGFRIIDYKTGTPELIFKDMEQVFADDRDSKYILQLMLYSQLFRRLADENEGISDPHIEPVIYATGDMENGIRHITDKRIKGKPVTVTDYRQINDEFTAGLAEKLRELFESPETALMPLGTETCKYCHLAALCRR